MFLLEILLPLHDNEGRPFGRELFDQVREELVDQYGGLTAFIRSPAEGVWEDGGARRRDEMIVFEVMTERLDRYWWKDYRVRLEERFRQDEIIVRAREIERM